MRLLHPVCERIDIICKYEKQKQIKAYLQVASPLVLSNLLRVLIPATDTFMVGHLGKQYLAAAALANSFSLALVIFLFGMSHGVVPLVAASIANFRYKEATQLLKHKYAHQYGLKRHLVYTDAKNCPCFISTKTGPGSSTVSNALFSHYRDRYHSTNGINDLYKVPRGHGSY